MGDTFVLVHGACHGGWCWSRVARLLREQGHEVFTPTLTGFGERAHLLSADTGPETLVRDVVGVLECEELSDVVLVGHSFGALVVLAVADRARQRLRRLVILDGVLVDPGHPGFDGLPPEAVAQRTAAAAGGLAYPPPPASVFGLGDPDDEAWVARRLTPHPLRTYTEPFPLGTPLGAGLPVTYVCCTDPPYPAISSAHTVARREGWEWRELATGHDAMISDPTGTVAELTRPPVAGSR
ncbi:alpha/beta fold hydrolase [Pseudonocardia abyssalis]|uniref:Alpha/beta hydrolase n=1 Tax=Pseudonocardia abyssalis TaxID=2792008 RepID=A0ABS6UV46_9PSEU|nr:alpha/beta hydrolase family protein [Pseudonocardia abyssalis]MBW0114992.1 alpha/beta hydrolase [Pseudonocardia abyssalis]MBW0136132.1 alpha/beta hydrolase [Pseudonocardia abyssalis]